MKTKTAPGAVLYLKGGTLVDPAHKVEHAGDLLLEAGKILAIGKAGELAGRAEALKAQVLELDGFVVAPGFVDLNAHIPDPGGEARETFATGSAAAVRGGFTTLAVMPVSQPVHDNAFITDFICRRAAESSSVKIAPIGCLSVNREGKRLAEMGAMRAAGARACTDIGSAITDSYLLRKAMEYSKAFAMPVFTYPEDASLVGQGVMDEGFHSNRLGLRGIPAAAEEIGVYRDTVLARHTGAQLHLSSLTTSGALRAVRRAKEDGVVFTAETNPQYFSLASDAISSYDSRYKVMPPLRSEEHREALEEALADGTLDCLASQHVPQTRSAKDLGFEQAAPGMIMLETCLPLSLRLVYSKKISLRRLVELLSVNPGRVLGLGSDYGNLRPGSVADIVVFDPDAPYNLRESDLGSLSRNTPFIGMKMQGQVVYTIVNGTIVYSGSERA